MPRVYTIRKGPLYYQRGPNPRWIQSRWLATGFTTDIDAYDEAAQKLGLDPTDILVEPTYR